MSRPLPKRTDLDDPTDAELSRWPGVTWSRALRGGLMAAQENHKAAQAKGEAGRVGGMLKAGVRTVAGVR